MNYTSDITNYLKKAAQSYSCGNRAGAMVFVTWAYELCDSDEFHKKKVRNVFFALGAEINTREPGYNHETHLLLINTRKDILDEGLARLTTRSSVWQWLPSRFRLWLLGE